MLSWLRKYQAPCKGVRDALEDAPGRLSSDEQQHLAACRDCQAVADEVFMSKRLLREMPRAAATPAPWFAPRVMAAIAARESELRHSLDAWAAVPRLAARLMWASAAALLLAGTWLYQIPRSTPSRAGNETGRESLFDSPQSSGVQDDAGLPVEKAQ
jgi:predicted anti-sigma-YlaC factor YlaD